MSDQVLRLPEVIRITGLSRTTIYARQHTGTFPKSINLGPRTVGWVASEIDAWLKEKIAESRKALTIGNGPRTRRAKG